MSDFTQRASDLEESGLSVVVPVYSGAAYLERLVDELGEVREYLESRNAPLRLRETVFVVDGAIDESADVLKRLGKDRPWIHVIHLSRNFGQHPATIAGILHTSGDWICTLDEDLQHRPRFLLDLLSEALISECDVVYARPKADVHGDHFRDRASRLFKLVVRYLTGRPSVGLFNSFRVVRGSIARAAASVSGSDTYFDVALGWFTSRIGSLPLPLRDVRSGKEERSGYTLRSLLEHGRRMLITSEVRALRGAVAVGTLAVLASIFGSAVVLARKVIYPETIAVKGWASLILSISFFGGLGALLMGVVLEYISVLVRKAHGRPVFFVVDRGADRHLLSFAENHIERGRSSVEPIE